MKTLEPITLAAIGPDSNARCIDHLTACVKRVAHYAKMLPIRYPNEERKHAEEYYRQAMTEADRLAFDCFLVRMKDPLAYEPGTPIHRFVTRALRMFELTQS